MNYRNFSQREVAVGQGDAAIGEGPGSQAILPELRLWSNIDVTKKNFHKICSDLYTCAETHIQTTPYMFVVNRVGMLLLRILLFWLNKQKEKKIFTS